MAEQRPCFRALARERSLPSCVFGPVLFWAFRYAEVYFGLPLVANRAILVPTAEEDPLIRMDVLEPFMGRADHKTGGSKAKPPAPEPAPEPEPPADLPPSRS